MKQTQKKIGNTQTSTPEQRDERRALSYALAIHGALILFMLFGFIASPSNPNPVHVELWADGTTPTAAEPETEPETAEEASTPPEPAPEPPPEPEPQPQPAPEPAPAPEPTHPTPPAEQHPPVPQPEPEVHPDTALEKARKEREAKEKAAAQEAAE